MKKNKSSKLMILSTIIMWAIIIYLGTTSEKKVAAQNYVAFNDNIVLQTNEDIPELIQPATSTPSTIMLEKKADSQPESFLVKETQEEKDIETDRKFVLASQITYKTMPFYHILHTPMNESISAKGWTNFIEKLDYQKIYFTQSDINRFETYRNSMTELLKVGDFSFAIDAYNTLVKRVEERTLFIKDFLNSTNLTFDADIYFKWNRKNEPFASSQQELDEIWQKRLLNSYLMAKINEEIESSKAQTSSASNQVVETVIDSTRSTNVVETASNSDTITVDEDADDPKDNIEKAIENTIKSHENYLSILKDSDINTYKEMFINSITMAYDPHSSFMSIETLEDFNIDMGLSLTGIGATLQVEDGLAKIIQIIPGSPADRDTSANKLVIGDKISAVAQGDEEFVDIQHWPLSKSVRLIRGKKGSVVRLKVIPASDKLGTTTKIVTLVRDEIVLEEQAAFSYIKTIPTENSAEKKLGYIYLPSFYSQTMTVENGEKTASNDILQLINELNVENVDGLILDLRNNGGGSLSEAINITGLFIEDGPVVQVRERRINVLRDEDIAVAFKKPLIVLVNRLSASASEIVAAALQDYGRAIIIGDTKTHGKGTVQSILPLVSPSTSLFYGNVNPNQEVDNVGALKLTSSTYYRISGRSTQLDGVIPDIIIPSIYDKYPDLGEEKLPNHIPWTAVRKASYTPVCNLSNAISELKDKSDNRMKNNDAWKKYFNLLDSMANVYTNNNLSLNYEKRLAYEMNKDKVIEESMSTEEPLELLGDDNTKINKTEVQEDKELSREEALKAKREKKINNDKVLQEAFNILCDLTETTNPNGSISEQSSGKKNFKIDSFIDSFFM